VSIASSDISKTELYKQLFSKNITERENGHYFIIILTEKMKTKE
jgi:hypothetical protein